MNKETIKEILSDVVFQSVFSTGDILIKEIENVLDQNIPSVNDYKVIVNNQNSVDVYIQHKLKENYIKYAITVTTERCNFNKTL